MTIKRDSVGDIFVFVVTDYEGNEVLARTGQSVGYDFGLKDKILISSNGKDIPAPSFLLSNMKALKRVFKSLSKKKSKSKKRERARLELARIYRRADNQRKDFHWKLARQLCSEYALICVADLNLKGLQGRHGKKMQDYGFGMFLQILKYVAGRMGTTIIQIDRFYPSSQLCSECGEKNPETKDLSVREWRCPKCGVYHDRDTNAAKNILKEGTRIFLSA